MTCAFFLHFFWAIVNTIWSWIWRLDPPILVVIITNCGLYMARLRGNLFFYERRLAFWWLWTRCRPITGWSVNFDNYYLQSHSKNTVFVYSNTPNRRRLILTRLFPSSLSSLLAGCQDQDGRRRQCSNPSLLQGQCLREEYGQPAQRGDVHRQRHHEAAQSGVGDGEDRQGKTHRVLNYRSIANKPPSIPPPQLFDMKKFQSNVNRELRRAYPDRRRLETQCLSAVAFVKSESDILDCPMWVLIVNVVAMDMLKSKLPPGEWEFNSRHK